jgi:hypothetical protein
VLVLVCAKSDVPKAQQASTPEDSEPDQPILIRMPESLAESNQA